jgi:ABC-type transporter lipoprotein component MlaA
MGGLDASFSGHYLRGMPDNILKRLTAIDPYVATRDAYVQCREKALEE